MRKADRNTPMDTAASGDGRPLGWANPSLDPSRDRGGFLLFEVLLAVAIFATGVLALGYAVNNCLDAQIAMADTERVRLAMENRVSEIYGHAVQSEGELRDELKGRFHGIVLTQKSEPFKGKDENGKDIVGLNVVKLTAEWKSGSQKQSREITFYVSSSF